MASTARLGLKRIGSTGPSKGGPVGMASTARWGLKQVEMRLC